MIGLAALAIASCTHDFETTTQADLDKAKYDQAFMSYIGGRPAADQDWGFGATTRAFTRSMATPAVAELTQPYDATWVANYLNTAKEPTSDNINHNYDNSVYHEAVESVWVKTADAVPGTPDTYPLNWWDWNVVNACRNNPDSDDYKWLAANVGWENVGNINDQATWDAIIAKATTDGMLKFFAVQKGTEGTPEQGYWTEGHEAYWEYDENWVLNFKITGTWSGAIPVVATEGLTDGVANNNERTVVVTGTWNITEDQRVGSKGRIIIANGGTVNVASGKTLNMVNQARLVVLPGGRLTGDGSVEVNNGNAAGEENYNGGTVDVAKFNNNFGKFYNYGQFLVNEYQGGAQESNFYNHSLANIHHFAGTGSTANARIFNACQFYVQTNARIRNYEGVMGSALIVGGELMFSSSEDGTNNPTYVGLAAGALVKCATLYNNGTSWTGPTTGGYGALEITDKITFLNWEQDHPEQGGYFANNLYVKCATWDNVPDGNGYHQTDASDTDNYTLSQANYKFWQVVANCTGNRNVTKVTDSNDEIFPASEGFVLGEAECTPGFKGTPEREDDDDDDDDDDNNDFDLRIIAEDLSATQASDFDFNDVVIDIKYGSPAQIVLVAAGGQLPLRVGSTNGEGGVEVHEAMLGEDNAKNGNAYKMINTGYPTPKGINDVPRKDITTDINMTIGDAAAAYYLRIEVFKNNEWQLLTANVGEPACKLAVDPKFKILNERESIKKRYPGFVEWATTNSLSEWWNITE